jgi:hypothetical protein
MAISVNNSYWELNAIAESTSHWTNPFQNLQNAFMNIIINSKLYFCDKTCDKSVITASGSAR